VEPSAQDLVRQASLARQIIAANVIAGLVVLFYLVLTLPAAEGDDPGLWGDLPLFAVYMIVLSFLGHRLGRRMQAEGAWLLEGRAPTEGERAAHLQRPWQLAIFFVRWWAVAAVVSGLMNRVTEHALASNIKVFVSVLLGGLTTGAIVYLLSERALRPVWARALAGQVPDRPRGLATDARIVMAWALGAGIPLVFIALIPVAWNDDRQVASWPAGVVFMAVGGLVAGAVVVTAVARSLAEPLSSVREGLARVQAGDLDVELTVDDAGEIGRLQGGFNQMVAGLRERERLHDLFDRHVGAEVAHRAIESGAELGGELLDVSVLFVDLIGSTALADEQTPAEVVSLLNRFFDAVVHHTTAAGGWVNKFEGDGALCVFGAPGALADHAAAALRAARALHDALHAAGLDAGIGVSSGEVVAGYVGAEHRFEYTVIGRPVNEAARLTDAAKHDRRRVLASATTVERAGPEAEHWRADGARELRGVSEPVVVAAPAAHG
jgi:adenylate cyclase